MTTASTSAASALAPARRAATCAPPKPWCAMVLVAGLAFGSLAGGQDAQRIRASDMSLFAWPSGSQSIAQRRRPMPPQVIRDGKSDRLLPRKAVLDGLPVAAVELIGADAVTILFRSRFGQLLFQSDPLTNTTYTAKDLAWPAFVVRRRAPSPVEERFPQQLDPAKRRPVGCEPVSSDIADPEGARMIGRCIAMAG